MTIPSTMPPNSACRAPSTATTTALSRNAPPRGDDEALGLCVGLDAHSTIRGSSRT